MIHYPVMLLIILKVMEKALPGYYEVLLETHHIKVELTASDRVAFHRYTFPKIAEKYVMINLKRC